MEKKIYKVKSHWHPMIANFPNKSYILPIYLEVPPGTTLDQVEWEKTSPVSQPDLNIIKVDSSSGQGKYQIQKIGNTYKCSCPGYWRSKDRICKHIKQIIS